MLKEKNLFIDLAQKALQKGDLDKAIYEYQNVLKLDPEDLKVHNIVGDLFTRKNKIPEAIKEYMLVAQGLSERGFFLKAVALYKKVSRLDPAIPEPYGKMAELYLELKLPSEAKVNYQWLIDYFNRLGNKKKVIQIFRKLCDLDPHNVNIRLKLVQMCIDEGMKVEASVECLKIGMEHFEKNEIKEAIAFFEKAVQLNPGCFTGYKCLGKCYFGEGQIDKAIPLFEKSFSLNSNDIDNLVFLAKSFYRAGFDDKAIDTFIMILNLNPSLVTMREKLARLYLKKGIIEKAKSEFEKVIEIFLERKEFKGALNLLEEIKRKAIFDSELKEKLVLVLRILGEKERIDELSKTEMKEEEILEEKIKKEAEHEYVEIKEGDLGEEGLEEVESLLKEGRVEEVLKHLEEKIEEEKKPTLPEREYEEVVDSKPKLSIKDREEVSGDFFDLKQSLKEDLEHLEERDKGDKRVSGTGEKFLDEIFDQFKGAIDKEVSSEDYNTHYNLGLAYMEMELFDDAVREFQKASEDPTLQKSGDKRFLDYCNLLGNCFIKMGLFQEAEKELEKGLSNPGYESKDYISLKFSKGIILENLKDYQGALRVYTDILSADPGNKEAKNRIKELQKIGNQKNC